MSCITSTTREPIFDHDKEVRASSKLPIEQRRYKPGSSISRRIARLREMTNMATRCTHTNQIQEVTPSAQGCEECLQMGDSWVHLRICLICGHVGCCDSSKNKHATKHFHATEHPIIQSFEPGEDWRWCYVDEVFV